MELLSAEEMRAADAHAIETLGIPSLVLMENAGRAVAGALLRDYPDLADRGVVVLCGKGNNGGDGLVVARRLAAVGIAPRVLRFSAVDAMSPDAAANHRAAIAAGIEVVQADSAASFAAHLANPTSRAVVVDALLGTGIRGGARGRLRDVIERLNEEAREVVAVDLPSGLDADVTEVPGVAARATRTYTLCRPKIALAGWPACGHAGRVTVLPIGIPDASILRLGSRLEWLDAAAVRGLLAARPDASHKGTYGHLLAVAGSTGKAGAAVLLARGALRAGVGLVTVATPRSVRGEIAVQQAEVMTEPLAETPDGRLGSGAAAVVLGLAAARTALALGPGLGTGDETRDAIVEIARGASVPAVIDADGLNAIAAAGGFPAIAGAPAPRVLTPHPGEASRLLRCGIGEIQADRLGAARRLAEAAGAVAVLKGHRSVVAAPDGRAAFNQSGNPGMATGGTGDVLTGIVGALLARGLDPFDAARLGTFLHGAAGDAAATAVGEESLVASDVVDGIPGVMRGIVAPEGAR